MSGLCHPSTVSILRSGVRLHPTVQLTSDFAASLSGHLGELSTGESGLELTTRHSLTTSPTRRLRFEDETETEAESRYLERQRRQVEKQVTSVLVSKPDPKLYVNNKAETELQKAKHFVGRHQRGELWVGGVDQWASCMNLGVGVNLNLNIYSPVLEDQKQTLYRSHLNWRTEPIRESYIGTVTHCETSGGGSGDPRDASNQAKTMTNQVQPNENRAKLVKTTITTDLPFNPYAPNKLSTPIQPAYLAPAISKRPSFSTPPPSAIISHRIRLNGTMVGKNMNQKELGKLAQARLCPRSEPVSQPEKTPWMKERGLDLRVRNPSSSSSSSSETTGDNICMFWHL